MNIPDLHPWDMSPKEALALQRELAGQVDLDNRLPSEVGLVGGCDVSCLRHGDQFYAAAVVIELPGFEIVEEVTASAEVDFPYVPGLLSFRELPVLLEAFRKLQTVPDAILVDGQGIAHPRRFGLASHLGVWLGLPTVGCAKSRLVGEHLLPGPVRGESVALMHQGEEIGAVLTTRDGVKPLYISPGHMVDFQAAVELTLTCGRGYRLPEPTRLAHHLSNRVRQRLIER